MAGVWLLVARKVRIVCVVSGSLPWSGTEHPALCLETLLKGLGSLRPQQPQNHVAQLPTDAHHRLAGERPYSAAAGTAGAGRRSRRFRTKTW